MFLSGVQAPSPPLSKHLTEYDKWGKSSEASSSWWMASACISGSADRLLRVLQRLRGSREGSTGEWAALMQHNVRAAAGHTVTVAPLHSHRAFLWKAEKQRRCRQCRSLLTSFCNYFIKRFMEHWAGLNANTAVQTSISLRTPHS